MKARTRTCATSVDARRRGAAGRQRGFTLVELLVAFALLALVTAIVPIAFDRLRESAQYRDTVRAILSELRHARNRALSEGREVRFTIDLADSTFASDGRAPTAVPPPLRIRTTVATIETVPQRTAAIRFLPDGGATGGTLEVLRPGGAGTRLTVDWLSGAVVQTQVQP